MLNFGIKHSGENIWLTVKKIHCSNGMNDLSRVSLVFEQYYSRNCVNETYGAVVANNDMCML